jgi:hypothetical protein
MLNTVLMRFLSKNTGIVRYKWNYVPAAFKIQINKDASIFIQYEIAYRVYPLDICWVAVIPGQEIREFLLDEIPVHLIGPEKIFPVRVLLFPRGGQPLEAIRQMVVFPRPLGDPGPGYGLKSSTISRLGQEAFHPAPMASEVAIIARSV